MTPDPNITIPFSSQETKILGEESEIIRPMNRENDEDDFVLGYMCLVEFECEIGAADDGSRVYPSERSLRAHMGCVDHCGIVEVKVSFVRVVQPEREYDFEDHPDTLTDEAKLRRSQALDELGALDGELLK